MRKVDSQRTVASLAGLAAIVLWSATVGLSRLVTEPLGPLAAGAAIYLLAGALGCAALLVRPGALRAIGRLPRRYVFGCGGLFALYTVCLYGAVALAAGRQQVLEVGVINYLWPGLTLVLSVPLLRKRAGLAFPVAAMVGFAGVVLATWPPGRLRWAAFAASLASSAWPYLLALIGAVTWALYSNLARRWAGHAEGQAVPLFVLATGAGMGAMRLALGGPWRWAPGAIAPLILTALGPALLGYVLWDLAMRRGHVTLVASAAYLTPLLSTGISCAVLGVLPGANLWLGCGLVAAGAVLCKLSLRS